MGGGGVIYADDNKIGRVTSDALSIKTNAVKTEIEPVDFRKH